MSIIGLVVFLILVGLAFWVIHQLAPALSIPPPIVIVLQVVIVVFAVLYLLQALSVMGGGPFPRLR